MKAGHLALAAAGMAAVLCAGAHVHASDRTGVYARVDKVVLEPDERAPQRIQIWGVFALADRRDPSSYLPAQRGYLYFNLPQDGQLAQEEWRDLKAVAGTSQIVAFGSRRQSQPKLRSVDEVPQAPDTYPINIGVVRINDRIDYAPVRALVAFKP